MKKNKKHKWKYNINVKKKALVLIILGVLMFVGLGFSILESNLGLGGTLEVKKYDRTFYTVMQNRVASGITKKYTGPHRDSLDPTKSTEDIYYAYLGDYYPASYAKNNVVFADYCWKIIRTTDTGGVKLLYSGVATKTESDGNTTYTCSDSSGVAVSNIQYNNSNEYPAYVGYMYDDTNNLKYELKTYKSASEEKITNTNNTIKSSTVRVYASNDATYKFSTDIIYTGDGYELVNPVLGSDIPQTAKEGYYTFNSTATTGAKPYFLVDWKGSTTSGSTRYDEFYYVQLSGGELLSNYYMTIGDSLSDNGDGTYTITDTNAVATLTPNQWINTFTSSTGKYICKGQSDTCSEPLYIYETKSDRYMYVINPLKEFTIGKGKNGFQLTDYITVSNMDWYNNTKTNSNYYSDYYYTCGNTDNLCTKENLRYMNTKYSGAYRYTLNYNYGKSVIYENNKFKLQDVEGLEIGDSLETVSTHHYTCINGDTECESVAYIYGRNGTVASRTTRYIEISDPNSVGIDAFLDNIYKNNTYDSNVKTAVEQWYEDHLKDTEYEAMIDDVIYCNKRHIADDSPLNETGTIKEYDFTIGFASDQLDCVNEEDQFSVSNPKATLNYKIGLPTYEELSLLRSSELKKASSGYWTMTPSTIISTSRNMKANVYYVNTSGTIGIHTQGYNSEIIVGVEGTAGIRPTIALVKESSYKPGGDGSAANPYVVDMGE